jgi:hypothetical protein
LRGDITLHFCGANAVPSSSVSGKAKPDSSPDPQADLGQHNYGIKTEGGESDDSQKKVTIKGIMMGGCTLFPGSQVLVFLGFYFVSKTFAFSLQVQLNWVNSK